MIICFFSFFNNYILFIDYSRQDSRLFKDKNEVSIFRVREVESYP